MQWNQGEKIMVADEREKIFQLLQAMDPRQVREVLDFALFLTKRDPAATVEDEEDDWSDQAIRDATAAACSYAEEVAPYDDVVEGGSGSGIKKPRRRGIDVGPHQVAEDP
jgi:hypothetical protein